MPIEHRMVARSLRYLQVLVNRKKDPIPKWVVAFIFLFVSVEMRSPPPPPWEVYRGSEAQHFQSCNYLNISYTTF